MARAPRYRWCSPGGLNFGAARPSREEARREGVAVASGKYLSDVDPAQVGPLWRSLEASGWTIQEIGA